MTFHFHRFPECERIDINQEKNPNFILSYCQVEEDIWRDIKCDQWKGFHSRRFFTSWLFIPGHHLPFCLLNCKILMSHTWHNRHDAAAFQSNTHTYTCIHEDDIHRNRKAHCNITNSKERMQETVSALREFLVDDGSAVEWMKNEKPKNEF